MAEILGDWIVNRPDVFVTARLQESEPGKLLEASEAILKRLQSKYVDLLLLPTDHIEKTQTLEVGKFHKIPAPVKIDVPTNWIDTTV